MAAFPPDPIGPGYRWGKFANYITFIRAINERRLALGGGRELIPEPTVGAYIGSARNSMPASSTDTFGVGLLQQLVQVDVPVYLPADADLDGYPADGPGGLFDVLQLSYTEETWRTAAVHAHTDGWRRACPRQIASTGATFDIDGNAAVAGQVAMGSPTSSIKFEVYTCASPGFWTPAPAGTLPDYLDSTQAAPDHCAPGLVRENDYLMWWHWKELHDGLALLHKFWLAPNWVSAATRWTGNSPLGYPTIAEAEAAAEGAWASAGVSSGFGTARGQIQWRSTGPDVYQAQLTGETIRFSMDTPPGVAGTAQLFVKSFPPRGTFGSQLGEFDAQGIPLQDSAYSLYDTQVYTPGTAVTFAPDCGLGSTMPAWPTGTPVDTSHDLAHGFEVQHDAAIIVVAPDFQYTS
jgi:hypothetical protein